jgi:hypothetical protein
MAIPDSKIISFDAAQSKQKDGQKSPSARIIAELRTICLKHLTDSLQRLLAVIDDELFKRSDKAESLDQQSLYFSAMRHVRVEANALQSNFHLQIARGYDEFWKKRPRNSATEPGQAHVVSNEQGLSLVEDDVLEEEIAISAMTDKGNNLFQSQLHGLNKRFAFLIDREELDTSENPLAPNAVCKAFSSVLNPLLSDLTIKLLIYKLFDQIVLSALGKLYHDLNAFLINEGILPTLSRNVKRSSTSFSGTYSDSSSAHGQQNESANELDDNQQAYFEVFRGMQQLLDGWRVQMGYPPAFGNEAYSGPVAPTGEVLNALNILQAPAAVKVGLVQPGDSAGLKSYVTEQLLKLQPGTEQRQLARPDEDIIDMVALIFDFILEDRNLPDPVKGLIARLQIPVVKVAIIEKSFFGRKNHPVRLLLNALAQAGIGLDTAEEIIDTPVYKKIENIVNRVLDEFDQNIGFFSDLLDEFMAFMEKETQRSRIAEERTRQVTQSKEQLHLAKRKIAYEISTRLEGKGAPAVVRSFLYNTWKDVLVLAYLRRDKQAGDWEHAVDIMDKLIWSVLPPTDAAMRKAVVQSIPKLLKEIRTGLESISLDPQSVATTIKALESCQIARLSKPLSEAHGPTSATAPLSHQADEAETRAVEIRDPELAQAITEIRGNLPDIENFTIQDLCRDPEEIGRIGHDTGFVVEDEYLFKARELKVGEWVEFAEGKKRVRGKLSWKSQITSTYVFVNRKGAKVLDIALSDLAKRMAANTARIIEDAGTPLMDRAFGALMSKLKAPVAKPA